ncbi:MAG: glycoside hydrolase family protein, partial [Planctomycetota bacterium]
KVFVAVTPLDMFRKGMALYHGEKENMPLPKSFRGKAFDDPEIMKAYLNYCHRVVKYFRPDYLAVGIEVNELIHNSADKWPGFVRLYRHVYSRLKKDYPQMPIFATFTLHNLLQENWSDIESQRSKVKEFLAEVDIVGISFYPFMKTLGPPERPLEAFDWSRKFVGDKPIAITETGFPAEPTRLEDFKLNLPGSPQNQAMYFGTLLNTAHRDRYLFVIAFLYRDYDALWEKIKVDMSGDWAVAWRDCGLVDGAGEKRPAYEVWRKYFSAKYLRRENIPEITQR